MSEISISISRTDLVEHLRTLQVRLSDDSRHNDALLVGFAIQAIGIPRGSAMIAPIETIQRKVCDAMGVRYNLFMSRIRAKKIVLARHVAMALARMITRESMPAIAASFGDRDHTTVLHGLRKMRGLITQLEATVPEDASVDQYVEAAMAIVSRPGFAPIHGNCTAEKELQTH